MELIDKADVVAEIKRIIDAENESINSFEHHRNASEKQRYNARMALLEHILFFLNTLEVKEFDMPVLDNRKMSVERWKEACKAACSDRNYRSHYGFTETRDDYFVDGVQWADEHPEIKEEDLEKEIELIKGDYEQVDGLNNCVTSADNPVDACYEMILKLHEQKLL